MKEQILYKAMKIKYKLDDARSRKYDVQEKRDLCTGNVSEVESRKFKLEITDGVQVQKIQISSRAAYEAMKFEYKNASKIVEEMEGELEQLN